LPQEHEQAPQKRRLPCDAVAQELLERQLQQGLLRSLVPLPMVQWSEAAVGLLSQGVVMDVSMPELESLAAR
jgi:hypothetical protein